MLRSLSALIALFVFWLLLSGYFVPFLVTAGLGSALGVVLLARRMRVLDQEGHPVHLGFRLLAYWPWLLKEIAKAAWNVSKIILHPGLPISPTMIRFKPSQRSNVGLVTHANSITLTPGTITVEIESGEFLVHALTRTAADGVIDSDMDRRVSRVEGQA